MSQVAFKNSAIVSIQQLKDALRLMNVPFVEDQPVPDAQWSAVRRTICAVAVAGQYIGTPEGMGWRVNSSPANDGIEQSPSAAGWPVAETSSPAVSNAIEQVMDHTYIDRPEAVAFVQRVQQYCQLSDVIVQLNAYNTTGGQAQYQILHAEDGTITVELEVN